MLRALSVVESHDDSYEFVQPTELISVSMGFEQLIIIVTLLLTNEWEVFIGGYDIHSVFICCSYWIRSQAT